MNIKPLIILFFLALTLIACNEDKGLPSQYHAADFDADIKALLISPVNASIPSGFDIAYQATAIIAGAEGDQIIDVTNAASLNWSVDSVNVNINNTDKKGLLTGINPGQAKVFASILSNGKITQKNVSVTVINDNPDISANMTDDITINGNPADNQLFPTLFPVHLLYTLKYTDGELYSSDEVDDDSDYITWTVFPSQNVSLDPKSGILTFDEEFPIGESVTVTVTANDDNRITDTIVVVAKTNIPDVNANMADDITINGNPADNQAFPEGFPIHLIYTIDFTDGSSHATDEIGNDSDYITWTVFPTDNVTLDIKTGILTFNAGFPVGGSVTVMATANSDSAITDTIMVVAKAAIPDVNANMADDITINDNPADNQIFSLGFPIHLIYTIDFIDGSSHSTDEIGDDSDYMTWTVQPTDNVTLDIKTGILTFNTGFPVGESVTVTATMNSDSAITDTIVVVAKAGIPDVNANMVDDITINDNPADNQRFTEGFPIHLVYTVDFTDKSSHSTDEIGDDSDYMTWVVSPTDNVTLDIKTGILTFNAGFPVGESVTVTATVNSDSAITDTIVVVAKAGIPDVNANMADDITINHNPADNQEFPKPFPIQLVYSVDYTDGRPHSTDDISDDSGYMAWTVLPAENVTLEPKTGILTFGVNFPIGESVIVTATVNSNRAITDTIIVIAKAAIPDINADMGDDITINDNPADNQSFPIGLPIDLVYTIDFEDGSSYSTDDIGNDADYIRWTVFPADKVTFDVQTGTLIFNANFSVGQSVKVTATAKNNSAISDTIVVVASDAIPDLNTDMTDDISIDNNSKDNQAFPIGLAIELLYTVKYTDGRSHSTDEISNDADYMVWSVFPTENVTLEPDTGILTFHVGFPIGQSVTVTATAKDDSAITDTIIVVASAAIPDVTAYTDNDISIDGKSDDNQIFPKGLVVELLYTVDFTDGSSHATDEIGNDAEYMAWSVLPTENVTLDVRAGTLTFNSAFTAGDKVTVTARVKSNIEITDTIILVASESVPDTGAAQGNDITVKSSNSAIDGQTFPIGIPIELLYTVEYTDGSFHDTDEIGNDSASMRWSVLPTDNVTIDVTTGAVTFENGFIAGETVTVTATVSDYPTITDTIILIATTTILDEGDSIVSLEQAEVDAGTWVQADMTFFFNGGVNAYTTHDHQYVEWEAPAGAGVVIDADGLINTSAVPAGTNIVTITGRGKTSTIVQDEEANATLTINREPGKGMCSAEANIKSIRVRAGATPPWGAGDGSTSVNCAGTISASRYGGNDTYYNNQFSLSYATEGFGNGVINDPYGGKSSITLTSDQIDNLTNVTSSAVSDPTSDSCANGPILGQNVITRISGYIRFNTVTQVLTCHETQSATYCDGAGGQSSSSSSSNVCEIIYN
ncbi:hypothetical protein HQQ94_16265 [Shewanella sp. VB17]|uniref:hypothetical protein n=1 Tax=Shewanella sp. VB17 TaxID=2739432 RepID=UPI001566D133|nr:hypothetical protein [Shewanella sp. VB17]NRD74745.1 hypothetical protein [Shewanella sp. VB17]